MDMKDGFCLDRESVPDIHIQGRTQTPSKSGTVIFIGMARRRGSSSYFNLSVCVSPFQLNINGTVTAPLDRILWDDDRRDV